MSRLAVPEPTPAVRFAGIRKRYRDRQVLDGVDFVVPQGSSVGIAGVNGAGKTSLLRCLLDFGRADTGEITLFGHDSRDPAARARVRFLPERFVPPPFMTGHEVLQWLDGLHGGHWTREQTRQAFARFDIPGEAIDRPVRHYSKGMCQKLGLASALLSDARLLVLDEPMSGLDPLARRAVAALLSMARSDGRTLLFTSHAPGDLERLCDRIVVLDRGRVAFDDTPAQLRTRYRAGEIEDAFVACIGGTPAIVEDEVPA